MSNFWAQKLGIEAPAPPRQPMVQQPWFAPDVRDTPQSHVMAPQGHAQQFPAQEEGSGWSDVQRASAKAMSARVTDNCPGCGSSHYFRPVGMPNVMTQCYTCGHNPRFSQTGGMGGMPSGTVGAEGATPARQVEGAGLGGVSQYSPGTIVAHL